ncbi:hypothetical protein LCGC14_1716220 [marine sediment metagenome]|uniref:Uncharacterized protein n=1 Tax=marine sediment metagenome TaxID=412755 RepID=A0A0F9HDI7_9ZZZZ
MKPLTHIFKGISHILLRLFIGIILLIMLLGTSFTLSYNPERTIASWKDKIIPVLKVAKTVKDLMP